MTLISVLLTLLSRRGARGHALFSDGSLQQQAARAEAAELYVGVARCTIIMYPISMEKEAQAFCCNRNWLLHARPLPAIMWAKPSPTTKREERLRESIIFQSYIYIRVEQSGKWNCFCSLVYKVKFEYFLFSGGGGGGLRGCSQGQTSNSLHGKVCTMYMQSATTRNSATLFIKETVWTNLNSLKTVPMDQFSRKSLRFFRYCYTERRITKREIQKVL